MVKARNATTPQRRRALLSIVARLTGCSVRFLFPSVVAVKTATQYPRLAIIRVGLVQLFGEGRGSAHELSELLLEDGADVRRDPELHPTAVPEHAPLVYFTDKESPAVLVPRRGPAPDQELLDDPMLGLDAVASPHAGVVHGLPPFRDHPLVALPERLLEQRLAVVEARAEGDGVMEP
jgi:hypothetical protein